MALHERFTRSRLAQQSSIYAAAGTATSALAAVSSAILARGLSTEEFGNYALAISLITFSALFFEFGIFGPAARLAARNQRDEQRRVFGAALFVCAPIAVAFALFIFAISFFVDGWFDVEIGESLRLLTPLLIAYPLSALLIQMAQGVGKLQVSATGSVLAVALTIVFLIGIFVVLGHLTVFLALLARTTGFLLSTLVMTRWLRPSFERVREWASTLIAETRRYGFNIYIGRVLSTGTYNMDVLMLGIWVNPADVGFYVLAGSLAYMVSLPVEGFAAALFPRMSREERLERRWVMAAAGFGALGIAAMWLGAGLLIDVVFGPRYSEARDLAVILSLAQAIRGVTGIYNTFMMAMALGNALRNAALVLTVSNVIFNFALIPTYGAVGAAWASVLALIANFFARIYYYRREMAALAAAGTPSIQA